MKTFLRYFLVGIFNTLVHWGVFYVVLSLGYKQSIANIMGFAVAVIVSYILNSLFTFKQAIKGKKFILFTSFMGVMSFTSGYVADTFSIVPLITLVFTSGFSLVLGYLFSKYVVFNEVK